MFQMNILYRTSHAANLNIFCIEHLYKNRWDKRMFPVNECVEHFFLDWLVLRNIESKW